MAPAWRALSGLLGAILAEAGLYFGGMAVLILIGAAFGMVRLSWDGVLVGFVLLVGFGFLCLLYLAFRPGPRDETDDDQA